jgi:hypothetical protein
MIEIYRDGGSDRKSRECERGTTMEESVKNYRNGHSIGIGVKAEH